MMRSCPLNIAEVAERGPTKCENFIWFSLNVPSHNEAVS